MGPSLTYPLNFLEQVHLPEKRSLKHTRFPHVWNFPKRKTPISTFPVDFPHHRIPFTKT